MGPKAAGAAFLLLLLIFGAEGKMCKWRSQTFKGRCTHNDNCVSICLTENATGGYCHGVIHRMCMCTKQCDEKPPPVNPPPVNPPPVNPPPVNPPPVNPPPVKPPPGKMPPGSPPEDPPEDPPGDEPPRA